MKVKDIMTPHAKTIWLTENLADAARVMWGYGDVVKLIRRSVNIPYQRQRVRLFQRNASAKSNRNSFSDELEWKDGGSSCWNDEMIAI